MWGRRRVGHETCGAQNMLHGTRGTRGARDKWDMRRVGPRRVEHQPCLERDVSGANVLFGLSSPWCGTRICPKQDAHLQWTRDRCRVNFDEFVHYQYIGAEHFLHVLYLSNNHL